MSLVPKTAHQTEFQKLCLALLNKFEMKAITHEEFERENAYLMLQEESFSEMIPVNPRTEEPTEPEDLLLVRAQSQKSGRPINKEFWEQPHIQVYLGLKKEHFRRKTEADTINKSHIHWLEHCRRVIPADDTVAHAKINARLNLFLAGRSGRESYTPSETRSRVYA